MYQHDEHGNIRREDGSIVFGADEPRDLEDAFTFIAGPNPGPPKPDACTSDDPAQHEGDTCPVHEDDDAPRVILVTIGRSFLDPATGKNLPMTGVEWRRFKRLVRNLLERHGALLFDGDGDGIWDENIETAHAFLYAPKGPQAYVKLALGSYAHQFGQEAIGWVDGRTEFLTP